MQNKLDKFWSGEFGNNYIHRNNNPLMIKDNIEIFKRCFLKNKIKIRSVLEYGSNIGINLIALKKIYKKLDISAVEINRKACEILSKNIKEAKIFNESILSFNKNNTNLDNKFDLVFTKTVLIHIDPKILFATYDALYKKSKKYIYIAEYYNPIPMTIKYRGYNNKLFKRDFAGDLLKKYKKLKLIDYGFIYSNDRKFHDPDNFNWFLFKK